MVAHTLPCPAFPFEANHFEDLCLMLSCLYCFFSFCCSLCRCSWRGCHSEEFWDKLIISSLALPYKLQSSLPDLFTQLGQVLIKVLIGDVLGPVHPHHGSKHSCIASIKFFLRHNKLAKFRKLEIQKSVFVTLKVLGFYIFSWNVMKMGSAVQELSSYLHLKVHTPSDISHLANYVLCCLRSEAAQSGWPEDLPTPQKIKDNAADNPLRSHIRKSTWVQIGHRIWKFTKIHQIWILRKTSHNPGWGVRLHHCIKSDDSLIILKFGKSSCFDWSKECALSLHQVAGISNATPKRR